MNTLNPLRSEIGFNVEIAVAGLPRKSKTGSERRQAKRELIRLCAETHDCAVKLNPCPAKPAPPVFTCWKCGLECNGDIIGNEQRIREGGPLFCLLKCADTYNETNFDRAKLDGIIKAWR